MSTVFIINPRKTIFWVGTKMDLSACMVKPSSISSSTVSLMLVIQSENADMYHQRKLLTGVLSS